MRMREEVIGKEVLDSSAIIIGKVKDVEINLETREIESFILGKGETIVPYEMVKKIGDKILLKNGVEEDFTI